MLLLSMLLQMDGLVWHKSFAPNMAAARASLPCY